MIKLYDSAFSPFARKVRMALEYKGLNYEAVDGLLKSNHQVNGRRAWIKSGVPYTCSELSMAIERPDVSGTPWAPTASLSSDNPTIRKNVKDRFCRNTSSARSVDRWSDVASLRLCHRALFRPDGTFGPYSVLTFADSVSIQPAGPLS
jgi:hypothetical protein